MKVQLVAGILSVIWTTQAWAAGWVLTTDYSTFGRVRSFAEAGNWPVSGDLAVIPGDAVARWHNGHLYVLGRGGSNVLQVYDPTMGLNLLHEFSLGVGLNPQDIAFDPSGEAYVSCYDQAVLLRVDVAHETVLATYATAAYADADGLPETAWMQAVGDRLYITCQKLDRANWYAPTGPGQLLVFDMTAEVFVTPIDLIGADPYTPLAVVPGEGRLRVGCAGFFGLLDGGIESVDLATGQSLGFEATEAALGGDVTAFVTTGIGELHVLVSDALFVTSLRRYDVSTGQVQVLATGSGYVHADLAYDGGFQIYVADRTAGASGLRVFDAQSGAELTTGVLPTGLPPFQIILPHANAPTPVPPIQGAGALVLSAPFPNPCNPQAEFQVSGQSGVSVRLTVFDLRGHRVAGHTTQLGRNGGARWIFDGRDIGGRSLPAGVYRVVAQSGTALTARSITLVK